MLRFLFYCPLFFFLLLVLGQAEEETCLDEQKTSCQDDHEECAEWALDGFCATDSSRMLSSCRKSCNICDNVSRTHGGGQLFKNCWGKPQVAAGSTKDITIQRIKNVTNYMIEHVFTEPLYKNVRSTCMNLNEECSFWAGAGRCEEDELFMSVVCSPACYSCHRCAYDNETFTPDAWSKPGDLDDMFLRITTEPSLQHYKPTVHFKPHGINMSGSNSGDIATAKETSDSTTPPDGPWVVSLDNFLDPEECEILIQLAHEKGFQASMLASSQETLQAGAVTQHRTSTNAFCDFDCLAHPVVQRVLKKMEAITRIPRNNAEHLQLVRYEQSQRYGFHHDYSPLPLQRVEGVRILTFFIYLNNVTEGGGTRFPNLNNFTVIPATGKVLIWPNVLNEWPHEQDDRTFHEALPVEKGVKYGANAWIHQREYIGPFDRGCLAVYQE